MKLSEENKEWMLKNVHCGKRFRGYDAALDYEVIEEKLLADQQRTDELETELFNAESKSYNETENKLVKLEDKIDELEKENAELKAHVNQQQTNLDRLWHLAEDLGACSEYLKVNFASGSYIPKQSLAQHDKEVAVKALMDFRKYLDEQGFKSVQKSVINKYAEQLQEQE